MGTRTAPSPSIDMPSTPSWMTPALHTGSTVSAQPSYSSAPCTRLPPPRCAAAPRSWSPPSPMAPSPMLAQLHRRHPAQVHCGGDRWRTRGGGVRRLRLHPTPPIPPLVELTYLLRRARGPRPNGSVVFTPSQHRAGGRGGCASRLALAGPRQRNRACRGLVPIWIGR